MYVDETKRINELFRENQKNVEKLYNNVDDLIIGIEELRTSSFVKRLIWKYFPDEKISENLVISEIDRVENIPNSVCIGCLRKAIIANGIPSNIVITKDISYKVALPENDEADTYQNGLIRDWFGSNNGTRNEQTMRKIQHRYKIFALGFILNLELNDFIKLLLQECGQANINFKDPYEVLYLYCLSKHTNVYENYTRLREVFENKNIVHTVATKNTMYYKNTFETFVSDDLTDEAVVEYLVSLPNIKSESFNSCFMNLYNEAKDLFDDEIIDDNRTEQLNKKDDFDDNENVTDNDFIKDLFGEENERRVRGNLKYIKERLSFNNDTLEDFKNGTKQPSRDNIIFLLFVSFVKTGPFDDIEDDYQMNPNGRNKIQLIYEAFSEYCNDVLEDIGTMELYLPNPVERFLVYCLMTSDPLAMMKKLFNK